MGFRDNARAFSSLRRHSFTFALPSRVPALAPVPIRGAPLPVLADSASGSGVGGFSSRTRRRPERTDPSQTHGELCDFNKF